MQFCLKIHFCPAKLYNQAGSLITGLRRKKKILTLEWNK
jgi:hypothetical protein